MEKKLGLSALTALVLSSMLGAGVFSLPQNMAAVASPAALLIGWGITGAGILLLAFAMLLRQAPEPPEEGTFLDLGCGWGPIALALGFASPKADIWALDVNERALELTRRNAELNGMGNIHAATADGIPAETTFDLIWSNPPIRVGKEVLHTLLMTWLPRLNAGGAAYLVVQKNLGSDSLIPWLDTQLGDGYEVSKYASSKGFRVIEVMKA